MVEILPKQRLFIMRHAERVDFTFGDWISKSFDENGEYIRTDLNMPFTVPPRKGGPNDFVKDCPLTNIGCYQANLTGQALKHKDIKFSHVFCSPSLRCIQTCALTLSNCGQPELPIKIEPSLFEWLNWYSESMPVWLTIEELLNLGLPIDLDYKPYISVDKLTNLDETVEEYYMRSYFLTKQIVEKYKEGNLLFVGHAATLDTCSRQLLKRAPRELNKFMYVVYRTPYASIVTLEKEDAENWKIIPPPIFSGSVLHTSNASYDCDILNS